MGETTNKPPWTVLLIGGASGTGKTSVSYKLAHHFGVGITEVDDLQVMLEKMTTPEEQPILHYWKTHPEADQLPAGQIVDQLIEVGRAMSPALEAVIASHIDSEMPIVLEGDFILPSLASQRTFDEFQNNDRVRSVFLIEEDHQQIADNYSNREPLQGEQLKRAKVSQLYGSWLEKEAMRFGLPVMPARPWDTLFERILKILK